MANNRNLVIQGLGLYFLYRVDEYKEVYSGKDFTPFFGNINMFFEKNEGKNGPETEDADTKKRKKRKKDAAIGKYIVEADICDNTKDFFRKPSEEYGAVFTDSLTKSKDSAFQIFRMKMIDGPNPNKVYFEATPFRNKVAMSTSLRGKHIATLVKSLEEDIYYVLDR